METRTEGYEKLYRNTITTWVFLLKRRNARTTTTTARGK